jgi:hypothetical protein
VLTLSTIAESRVPLLKVIVRTSGTDDLGLEISDGLIGRSDPPSNKDLLKLSVDMNVDTSAITIER